MQVSCVVAVHNEAEYLPCSLPSLLDSRFDEVVFVLDRCTDKSEQLIHACHDGRFKTIVKPTSSWNNPCAETKSYGVENAAYDLLMMSDADIILDTATVDRAVETFQRNGDTCLINFSYKQYSLWGSVWQRLTDEWTNLLGWLIRKLNVQPKRSGIYMIKKQHAHLADHPSEYDELQQKHPTVQVESNTVHLRPRRNKGAQIARGRSRASLPQYSLVKTLLMSVLLLQPYMFSGYLQARRQH